MTEKARDVQRTGEEGRDRHEEVSEGTGPAKRHGDALRDGSGTRHGVTSADERPVTDADEDRSAG